MSENAGEYNRKIQVQRRSGAVDGSGQLLDDWITIHELWSKIKTETGMATIRQAAAAQGVMTTTTRVSFRIRYRKGIDEGMRVFRNGVAYDILRVQTDEANREWTDLVCEEGGNAG